MDQEEISEKYSMINRNHCPSPRLTFFSFTTQKIVNIEKAINATIIGHGSIPECSDQDII
jgi:hypothetical protein